jgi:ribose/xylose/arabinose/galactoside ABC-type transport system permease subunit
MVNRVQETVRTTPAVDATVVSPETRGAFAGRLGRVAKIRQLALVPVLILAVIIGSSVNSAFLTERNVLNILQQSSELSVLVLLVGRFDLSLESTFGLAPMVGAWLVSAASIGGSGLHVAPALAIIACLAVGAIIGAFNGFLVSRMRLSAFIVTLSMLILLRGVALGTTSGQTLFNLPSAMLYLGSASWLGVPVSIWVAGILYAVTIAFLRYHRTGRAIYAIGGNAEAARAAGIRVERIVWMTFIVAGVLAALAGLMLTGRIASVTSGQGQNLIFTVFAAAVIGGISLNGGRGTLFGALTGVLLLGVIQNILTLSGIASYWIDACFGAIILISLIFARITTGEAQE